MTNGLHAQNNKAFSDHVSYVTSCFTDSNYEVGCSTDFATEDAHLSSFIP